MNFKPNKIFIITICVTHIIYILYTLAYMYMRFVPKINLFVFVDQTYDHSLQNGC